MASASILSSIKDPKPWSLANCGDFWFEVSLDIHSRGVKKYHLGVCPSTSSFRYTLDEKGEGLVEIPWTRVQLPIVQGMAGKAPCFVMRVGGSGGASHLVSALEHRVENERDRDAMIAFLNGLLAGHREQCADFGGLTPSMPVLQGAAKKKGKLTWSARYLALQPGRLLIFRSFAAFTSHHHPPLNVLSLSFIAVERSADLCVLSVRKAERDYVLQFANPAERDRWVSQLIDTSTTVRYRSLKLDMA
jgi:hypothetical protein